MTADLAFQVTAEKAAFPYDVKTPSWFRMFCYGSKFPSEGITAPVGKKVIPGSSCQKKIRAD